MCVIVLDMAVLMWHNEEGLRFPMHPIVGTIGIDGSRSRAQKWAWPIVCIPFLSLLLAGCALFGGSSGGNAGSGTSLDDFISGTMPLPPGAAGASAAAVQPATPENEEMAGLEPQIEDISFTPAGEPILRTGYILRIAVTVGDRVEVNPVEVQVSDKNEITLPFVGKVDCAGLTINGLRSRLATGYSKYFRNPEVTISFVIREAFTSPWGRLRPGPRQSRRLGQHPRHAHPAGQRRHPGRRRLRPVRAEGQCPRQPKGQGREDRVLPHQSRGNRPKRQNR